MVEFEDDTALVFTVAMYGGIFLHQGEYDNEYYMKSKQAVSPFSKEYKAYYDEKLAQIEPTLSAKAFLATEQRFPGIGNGVCQDILFEAKINGGMITKENFLGGSVYYCGTCQPKW